MKDEKMIGFWIDMDDGGRTEFSKERSVSSVDELMDLLREYRRILVEDKGFNQEEVRGLNRVKEIMRLAHKLKWVYPPNKTSYPLMQLSEVEKCMLAMYNDYDLNRMKKWVEETQSSEQKEAEGLRDREDQRRKVNG